MRRFLTSVSNAIHGLVYVFSHESNFRIQVVVSLIIMAMSIVFPLKGYERIVIMLLITFVLVLELVNSAIEKFTDIIKPRLHTHVGIVKDIMAATVLISSVGAALLGMIIFIPYIIEIL